MQPPCHVRGAAELSIAALQRSRLTPSRGPAHCFRFPEPPAHGRDGGAIPGNTSPTGTNEGHIQMISALLPNYNRADLAFERGEGAWLWTTDGRRFLDFGSGLATTSLGHGHKALADAIGAQAHKLMHVSNLYRIPEAERLAERLVKATFADTVFFCNSGAEANEGM